MLDDATVHIEGAASCGYRYTTATRLDVYKMCTVVSGAQLMAQLTPP